MKQERTSHRSKSNGNPELAEAERLPQKLSQWPHNGLFGEFGGQHNCEGIESVLKEIEDAFEEFKDDDNLQRELRTILTDYGGRQTSIYFARRLTRSVGGARIYLKREDLAHNGLIDLSNALSQALLARKLKKSRLLSAVLTPKQGVAIAMAAKIFGMDLTILMGQASHDRFGASDSDIQHINRMGAQLKTVSAGSGGVLDALNGALSEWRTTHQKTHLAMMLPLGPHPFPWIVRECQRVIGDELKGQILRKERRLPDQIVVRYHTGSEVLGVFAPFVDDEFVKCVGVEIMREFSTSQNPLLNGKLGIYAGMKTLNYQTHGVGPSASHYLELPCPVAAPELAFYHENGRLEYFQVTKQQARDAYNQALKSEGMILSHDSSHVLYALIDRARQLGSDGLVVGVISGIAEDSWLTEAFRRHFNTAAISPLVSDLK